MPRQAASSTSSFTLTCFATLGTTIRWLTWPIRLLACWMVVIFPVTALAVSVSESAPAPAAKTALSSNTVAQRWNDLIQRKTALEQSALQAKEAKSSLQPFIQQQLKLTNQYVFDEAFQALEKQILPILTQTEGELSDEQKTLLVAIENKITLADQIDQTFKAEQRGITTQTDSKMYFKMRVRSEIPAKTLNAYGLMALAKNERDQGHFDKALKLWEKAEVMIKESFNEHIAHMAQWREEAKRDAEKKQRHLREKALAILESHFVTIPAGEFIMGSDSSADEAPPHPVRIPAFQMGKTEVTYELYDLCVESTHCYSNPQDEGWGRADRPVINVSFWDLEKQFFPWINSFSNTHYRLPSEAEWEYAASAGSTSAYGYGSTIGCAMARFDGGINSVCNAKVKPNIGTAPVAQYLPNAFGLYDMHGNAWEWVQDCWNPSYENAPDDGSPWLSGKCAVRVLKGGSWSDAKTALRSANRYYFFAKSRRPNYGFRLAADLPNDHDKQPPSLPAAQ